MSVSGISGGMGSIREFFQKAQARGGITKDDLSTLQTQLKSSKLASGVRDLASSFDQIDVDSNGKLDQSEMATYSKSLGLKAGGGRPPGPPPEMTKDELTQVLSDKKANGDTDPLLSALVSSFDSADSDQDGKVSQSEFKTFADANGFKPKGSPPPPQPDGAGGQEQGSDAVDSTENSTTTSAAALKSLLRAYWAGSYASSDSSLSKDLEVA
jgi:Ca2+-binding EF-hand superfamily protein